MELDDLKTTWQALDARMARHDRLQLELLREQRLRRARRNLRPLLAGMALQAMLGVGLVLLGIACWKHNPGAPGFFAAGVLLHAFGIAHVAFAGIVAGLAANMDLDAPVLAIQKRLRLLLRAQVCNSNVCGAPWWVMWVVVVVGVAGLSPATPAGGTPAWIWVSLAIGVAGTVGTWTWTARSSRQPGTLLPRIDDGADRIRRNLHLLDDIERFERDSARAPAKKRGRQCRPRFRLRDGGLGAAAARAAYLRFASQAVTCGRRFSITSRRYLMPAIAVSVARRELFAM